MDKNKLCSIIESLLFVSGEVVPLKDISLATGVDEKTLNEVLEEMVREYSCKGIRIIQVEDGYQMCTSPDCYDYIKKLYTAPTRKKLSVTLLETLAIIAYKQPITKSAVESIRGVSADHAVNKLVEYDLVCEMGRLEAPGHPILFGTTDEFLRFFNLPSLSALPKDESDMERLRKEAEEEVDGFAGK